MDPLTIFNSTFLVFWITFIFPKTLEAGNKYAIWGSSILILVIEVLMCLKWANREFPFNLLAAGAIFLIALMGGRVMHLLYQKLNVYKEDP